MPEKAQQFSASAEAHTSAGQGEPEQESTYFLEDDAIPPKKRSPWFFRYKWVAILILIAAAITWYLSAGKNDSTENRPLTVKVEVGDIENAVTAAGTLQPSEYVDVGAQVSGQLEKLHVEVGDFVKAGDLVAEIDATVQLNRVEASRANLEALQAQLSARESSLSLAKARLERQTIMMADDATSQDDYDDAVDRLASAQSSLIQLRSQIAQAKASLGSDEATLGYSKIYAPIDGTVVSIEMKEGQTLNAVQMAPTILRIADLTTMTVEAEVSEADIGKLTRGMNVYFTTLGSGERRWTGTLRQIFPTPVIENNVVLYTALFDVDNDDGALLTDMTAQVFFVTASVRGVLKIPVAALTASGPAGGPGGRPMGPASAGNGPMPMAPPGNGANIGAAKPGMAPPQGVPPPGAPAAARGGRGSPATVKVVHEDGSIEERSIRVGLKSRISAEVLSGLKEGEDVVAGIVDTANNNDRDRGPRFGPF